LLLFFLMHSLNYYVYWGLLPKLYLVELSALWVLSAIYLRFFLFFSKWFPFRNRYLFFAYLLLVTTSVLQLIWYPKISAEVGLDIFLKYGANTFVAAWTALLGGEALVILVYERPRLIRVTLWIVYLILAFTIVYGVGLAYKLFGSFYFAIKDPASTEVFNYLWLGDSLAGVALLLIGLMLAEDRSISKKGVFWKVLGMYGFFSLLLFFSYSRTSFFTFLLSGIVLIFYMIRQVRGAIKRQLITGVTLILGLVLPGVLLLNALRAQEGGIADRPGDQFNTAIQRFTSLTSGTDVSLQERIFLFKEGLGFIERYWLLGFYMADVVELGKGYYIHNWLSFWVSYGITPFVFSIWILLALLFQSWRQRKENPLAPLSTSFLVFVLLAIAFSRAYIWPFFWLGLGLAGSALSFSQGNHLKEGE
ncbi:MAG: hypothetical protein ACUVQZ_10240, partial [Candidatus Caldatribacteriaceae bacterium]